VSSSASSSSLPSSSALAFDVFFPDLMASVSTSARFWRVSISSIRSSRKRTICIRVRSDGSNGSPGVPMIPSFEYGLDLFSRSTFLNSSIRTSMSLRDLVKPSLSLISGFPCHCLIESRKRCSFLISFFRSSPCFSRCDKLVACSNFASNVSKASLPSSTFFSVLSTSAFSLRLSAMIST